MAEKSRTQKTFLNARVNLIFYCLTLALSFFSRKIFLDILGADFMGLTGTLYNLLSFLNIVELGIGTTIGYVLYKPLFENNQQKINEIISVFGYMYRWVGIIILIAGIILSLFLPLIFPHTPFNFPIIYLAYYAFLASSLIGYFINYKQTLLSADQKNYVVTAYFQTGNIVKIIIQMISAYYTCNYYLWIAIEFIFGIIYSFILNWKINIVYPWLKSEIKDGKQLLKKYPEIIKLTKQVFIHRLGSIVQFQLTPFLVYTFVSLQTVAFYSNYTLITEKLNVLLKNFLDSTAAGIGNLIAEGNKNNIMRVYWELMAIRFFMTIVIVFSLFYLLPIFIELWLGCEYILSDKVLFSLLIIFALNTIRGTTDQFISGYGLYKDTWAPIAEIIIFTIVAIVGGHFWGLEGLLQGSIISLILIVYGWKPYFLFKYGFKMPLKFYWYGIIKLLVLSMITLIIFRGIDYFVLWNKNITDWYSFILYSIYIGFSFASIQFCLLYLGTEAMKNIVKRMGRLIASKL